MEAFAFILILAIAWVVLAAGALELGVDSRPGMADDHAR
jgi:hypothetical protein